VLSLIVTDVPPTGIAEGPASRPECALTDGDWRGEADSVDGAKPR
jgi:hypothetical protein